MNASVVLSPGVSDAVRLDPCEPLLDIRNLTVEFRSARGSVRAIDDLSLVVRVDQQLNVDDFRHCVFRFDGKAPGPSQ